MNMNYEEEIYEKAQKYYANEFDKFVDEYGWTDWMNDFIISADGKMTKSDRTRINRVLRDIFYKAQADLDFYYVIKQKVYANDSLASKFWHEMTDDDPIRLLLWGDEEVDNFTFNLNEYIKENSDEDEEIRLYKFGEATELANAEYIKESYGYYDKRPW